MTTPSAPAWHATPRPHSPASSVHPLPAPPGPAILLVEATPADARLVEAYLAEAGEGRFQVDLASDLSLALALLGARSFDIVLLDLSLPDSQGLDAFVRLQARAPDLPVVVLCDPEEEPLALQALHLGAQDYLLKDELDARLLARSLRCAVERKRLEAERKQLQEQLEAERTWLRTLMAVVAHELRQPLTVISGYASLLARSLEPQDPTLARQAEHIRASTRQLQRLVGDLLDVSRLKTGTLEIRPQRVDLAELVAEVAERSAALLAGHSVRIKVRDPLPPVEADPGRLEQVLDNLLANAATYGSPDTEILVELSSREHEVEVAIINRGPRIPGPELAELFSRFHRPRRARPGATSGLGLGLYICRGLVEAHGGRIWAASTRRRTTFRFTLPLAPAG